MPPGPPPQPCCNRGDDDEVVWEADFLYLPGPGSLSPDSADEYDDLGFAWPPTGDAFGQAARAYDETFQPKASRRLVRFEAKRRQLRTPGDWTTMPQKDLKVLLRKGVPHKYRAEVWWSILGCEDRKEKLPKGYSMLVQTSLENRVEEEIERDLSRTFPDHQTFRSVSGRSQLRNVLRAFASSVPKIQYCQGLNFIAAILLVVFSDEERAFWAMLCAMEILGVERYYTEGMTLLRADLRALTQTLHRKCPKVAQRLSEEGIDLTSICSEWYVTWYAKCLPAPTILRVWDALFMEGFKVMFRVAVGIFKRTEDEILRCDGFEQLMQQAKEWPRRQIEHNELLKASFRGRPPMRRRDLIKDRDDALGCIAREDAEQKKRAQANREAAVARRLAAKASQAETNQVSPFDLSGVAAEEGQQEASSMNA